LPTSSCYAPPAAAFRLLGSRAPYLKKPRSALSLSDLLDAGFSYWPGAEDIKRGRDEVVLYIAMIGLRLGNWDFAVQ